MQISRQIVRLILGSRTSIAPTHPVADNQYRGDYGVWRDALAAATGYDAKNILEKQLGAMRRVRDGSAVYERDSVLFDEIEYSFPLLAALLYASQRNQSLTVVDFGGALGSSYFQNKDLLSHLPHLRWCVIEQPHFVEIGKSEFENGTLRFYKDLETCLAHEKPDLILLSSVLQYLDNPFELLTTLGRLGPRFIVIDRTPVVDAGRERIVVQHVPPSIYEASYACRLFEKGALEKALEDRYALRYAFDAHVGSVIIADNATARYRGFFFERREPT